jgi:hypothetical protein
MVGEHTELDLTTVIEAVGCLDQADGTCRDKILNGNG